MTECIIISPTALLPQADAFAASTGLPEGQFTQPYGDDAMLCHFVPAKRFKEALDGPLPPWAQVVDVDADPVPADPAKVCVFLSGSLGGWMLKGAVDEWPRV